MPKSADMLQIGCAPETPPYNADSCSEHAYTAMHSNNCRLLFSMRLKRCICAPKRHMPSSPAAPDLSVKACGCLVSASNPRATTFAKACTQEYAHDKLSCKLVMHVVVFALIKPTS